jgi:hypothetical protein
MRCPRRSARRARRGCRTAQIHRPYKDRHRWRRAGLWSMVPRYHHHTAVRRYHIRWSRGAYDRLHSPGSPHQFVGHNHHRSRLHRCPEMPGHPLSRRSMYNSCIAQRLHHMRSSRLEYRHRHTPWRSSTSPHYIGRWGRGLLRYRYRHTALHYTPGRQNSPPCRCRQWADIDCLHIEGLTHMQVRRCWSCWPLSPSSWKGM